MDTDFKLCSSIACVLATHSCMLAHRSYRPGFQQKGCLGTQVSSDEQQRRLFRYQVHNLPQALVALRNVYGVNQSESEKNVLLCGPKATQEDILLGVTVIYQARAPLCPFAFLGRLRSPRQNRLRPGGTGGLELILGHPNLIAGAGAFVTAHLG